MEKLFFEKLGEFKDSKKCFPDIYFLLYHLCSSQNYWEHLKEVQLQKNTLRIKKSKKKKN